MPIVAHNIIAQFTNRQLNISTKDQAKSVEKLNSGYRINRSADDAAGLQISEKMRWQIRGLNKAVDNCEGGASFCQVADGAMSEISDMIHRMRELSVQAANDTNTAEDRAAIQDEINALMAEIERVTNDTEFNTIDVFGWEMTRAAYVPDGQGGWTVSGSSQTTTVTGNNYGLALILGDGNIYTGSKLNDPLRFDGGGWTSTGDILYTRRKDVSSVVTELNAFTNTVNSSNLLLNSLGSTTQTFDDITNGYRVTVTYDSQRKTLDGMYPAKSIILDAGTYTNPADTSSFVKSNRVKRYDLYEMTGSIGFDNGKPYASAWMDFSGLDNGKFSLSDLYGQGFNSTCASCSRHYSISFTDQTCDTTNADGVNYTYDGQSWHSPRLEINLSGCTTGEDIVKRIMSAAKSCSGFSGHYTQYAVNSANPTKLYVYDNRNLKYNSVHNISTFEPAMRNQDGYIQIGDVVVTPTNPPGKIIYTTKDMWIQSGTTDNNGFFISKPKVNPMFLGVNGIGVEDFESASAAIVSCDIALSYLNAERTKIGAELNRLETASAVDANTEENSQAAESRIRDVDYADETVEYTKHNILSQAGQSMLAQANKMTDGVLQLLQ